jgi:hypothetical protein
MGDNDSTDEGAAVISGAMGIMRKHFIYGRSRRLYRHISYTRPLTRLAGLLVGGVVAWNVGQLSASLWRREW